MTNHTTPAPADHRKYDPLSVFKTMRISGEADDAIEQLRRMWLAEYPESKYPSIALIFEVALQKLVVDLSGDARELKREVEKIKKDGFGFRRNRQPAGKSEDKDV